MKSDYVGTARRSHFAAGGAAIALATALLVAAPPAYAADNWSGIWNTHHQFSDPRMNLDLDVERGPDNLDGTYRNTDGTRGRLNGEVTKRSGEEIWTGTFRDYGGDGARGNFRIVLQSDRVSFIGWFRVCDGGGCSPKRTWTGEHA